MFTNERSMDYPDGHRNVMFAQGRGVYPLPSLGVEALDHSLFKVKGDPTLGTPDTKMLYAYLRHFGGICASHTTATYHGGTDWRDNDRQVEPVVEIYQGLRALMNIQKRRRRIPTWINLQDTSGTHCKKGCNSGSSAAAIMRARTSVMRLFSPRI